ncbi:MAG: polysaccharide biosynthesis/export family protein [Alphaproteobacteria bacterium]
MLLVAALLLLGCGVAFAQKGVAGYRLGSGDVIAISVYGEEDLSIEERIHDDGIIAYPFLGELKVGGRRIAEVEQYITKGLKGDYLVDPRVRVTIREYRPFFIHGEVESPGGYPYQPGLTVRKAMSLAGGLTERASKSKITVIREGRNAPLPLSIDDSLGPGDIINVPQSFF